MLHPKTYLNKILFAGEQSLQLWNTVTKTMVYDFPIFKNELKQGEIKTIITSICDTPALDIIAICLSNG